MSFFYFPSDIVYWEKTPHHKRIKEKFLPRIMSIHNKIKNNPFPSSELNTSFYYDNKIRSENHFLNDKDLLNNVIFKTISNMRTKHNAKGTFPIFYNNLFLHTAWWNHYDQGHFQEPHSHLSNSILLDNIEFFPAFSVVYILHDPNDKNNLLFQKTPPLPFMDANEPLSLDTSNIDKNSMSEGSVIVFPCTLTHMVKPCLKPGRITIAFNVYADIKSNHL